MPDQKNNPYYGQSSQQQYAPPSGPPPGRQEYAPPPGAPPSRQQQYAAPSGPPPLYQQQQQYAPPSGPPPGKGDYAPPSGPPPSADWAAPPPGPPPSHQQGPGQHNWEAAVPDTSLLPPPPNIFSGFDESPANNATQDESDAGRDWCEQHPLVPRPITLDSAATTALANSNIRLLPPSGFSGELNPIAKGHWEGFTDRHVRDSTIIGYPPLYAVNLHDPTKYGVTKTIYYEVKIRKNSPQNCIALGFTALPYPTTFRCPGWHRGSLAVHGDDGHKYINDDYGGKEFTAPLKVGETYGIGMTFTPTGSSKPTVTVFFTREGKRGGECEWDLHEETDTTDNPVTGLEGFHDLSCAIGVFKGDEVKFEIILDPAKWKYRGVPV